MFKYLLIAGLVSSAIASEIPTSTKRIDSKVVNTTNYHPYLTESLKGCDPKVLTAAKEDIKAQLEKTEIMENSCWAGWVWSLIDFPFNEVPKTGIVNQFSFSIKRSPGIAVFMFAALYIGDLKKRQQEHLSSFDNALILQKNYIKFNSTSKKEDY